MSTLGCEIPLDKLTEYPYPVVSQSLKSSMLEQQQILWWEESDKVAHLTNSHHLSKKVWGFENALLYLDTTAPKNFIKFRAGAVAAPVSPKSGRCNLCESHPPTRALLLWACEATAAERLTFMSKTRHLTPRFYEKITNLQPREAMHEILRGAERDNGPKNLIRDLCITFVNAVVAKITYVGPLNLGE